MTKNQFLGRCVIQRLRLNPTLKSTSITYDQSQSQNYLRQYLHCREEVLTFVGFQHTRCKLSTIKFFPHEFTKGPLDGENSQEKAELFPFISKDSKPQQ